MLKHDNLSVGQILESSAQGGISIADVQRRRTHPVRTTIILLVALAVITIPFGVGRHFAFVHTKEVISFMTPITPSALVVLTWSITILCMLSLVQAVIESSWRLWGSIFLTFLALEQFISGVTLLGPQYWYGTAIVFGKDSVYPNACNAGILSAALCLGIFAAVYVLSLVLIKKDSKLNILTRSWSALFIFFIVEVIGLCGVIWGHIIHF